MSRIGNETLIVFKVNKLFGRKRSRNHLHSSIAETGDLDLTPKGKWWNRTWNESIDFPAVRSSH